MLFTSVHILGIITSVVAAYEVEDSVERRYGDRDGIESIKLNPRIKENRDQLKSIIKFLNGHLDDPYERRTENSILHDLVAKDPETENDNLVDEQEARILAALSLLQKNYNYQLRHGNDDNRIRSRLFYIENPEVLEEFKSNLRTYHSSTSSESSEDDSEFDRILTDEIPSHRKFDNMIGPSQDRSAHKSHGHSHPRGHKNRNSKRGNAELRNGSNFKNVHQKGRFKITSDKRNRPNIEGKRKKPLDRNTDRLKKVSDENLNVSNEKYNRKEKKIANVLFKEFSRDRDVPSRPKYAEKKYSGGDILDKSTRNKEPYKRKRPKEYNGSKLGGRNSQSLGRTFIPYIAKKTVYEDDD